LRPPGFRQIPVKVIIKDAADLEAAVAEACRELGFGGFRDQNVFIKPNMLRVARPEDCATTDPKVLGAVVNYVGRSAAGFKVGDNPIPQRVNEIEVARVNGYLDVSAGNFRNVGLFIKKVKMSHPVVKETYVSQEILESDVLVSVPKFKVHPLTVFTCAVKNHFGIVPGGIKLKLHADCRSLAEFCGLLIDIYRLRPPDLIVVDYVTIRDAAGRLFRPNLIVCGDNGFAVDYACELIAGEKKPKNPLLKLAIERGLFDPGQVEILGRFEKIKGFTPPFTFGLKDVLAGAGQRLYTGFRFGRQPVFDRVKCTRCQACDNICPVSAIEGLSIDRRKCIRCYCCIEVCPQNAINKKFKL
jgi:uncharacterized protein (DUF362 family)/Pyruvate/2-oxoacid:ferredoxin oxidoreductase delta subunit